MPYSFKGGIHPDPHKVTSGRSVEFLTPPEEVIIPVSMHIGVPCTPTVKVGDRVLKGQKIADSDAFISAPIHASISGTVKAITPMRHPAGSRVMSVIIENDGLDEWCELTPVSDWQSMPPDVLTQYVRDAGVVGHGGATFPTHAKIRSALGKIDTVILNGAECEPYITSDHRLLLENTREIIGGAQILLHIFKDVKLFIAIEQNKPDAIEAVKRAVGADTRISVVSLRTKYPQGSEKQLIKSITGREVPPGKLPADAKCAVFNVDTAAAIYRAIEFGIPVIRRVVTVSGSAITAPKNLEVRVGTPLRHLVDACGGFSGQPTKLILGGPMMGATQYSLDVPVIKGTNALLALCENEDRHVDEPVCIRCGRCVQVCPMRLLPTYIYMNASKERWDECEKLHVLDCMECGACTYECPGSLYLTQSFRVAKAKIIERRKK